MAQSLKRDKPFTGEVIRLYEENTNRPGKDARRALAMVFDRTETYIEFGDTVQQKLEAREPAAAYGDSPEVARLIRAFSWLTDDEKATLLGDLESKAATNKAIAKQLGPRFKIASDETYRKVLERGGDFPPGTKKRQSTPRRRPAIGHPEDPDVE